MVGGDKILPILEIDNIKVNNGIVVFIFIKYFFYFYFKGEICIKL